MGSSYSMWSKLTIGDGKTYPDGVSTTTDTWNSILNFANFGSTVSLRDMLRMGSGISVYGLGLLDWYFWPLTPPSFFELNFFSVIFRWKS